ncbi:transferrin-binding protein-like solute binding protein [Roseobacter sp. HKCCA0434]|uniref:transferrin-binding protein-like solute binding protein n=1 Tax=Roseobacter sp. HKCCA0434 TaxID=3079297 RepID=UPI00290591D5|nr:transferrin-binding protein-like solute binding protein [Roseobacter sp. HKCCA0434]
MNVRIMVGATAIMSSLVGCGGGGSSFSSAQAQFATSASPTIDTAPIGTRFGLSQRSARLRNGTFSIDGGDGSPVNIEVLSPTRLQVESREFGTAELVNRGSSMGISAYATDNSSEPFVVGLSVIDDYSIAGIAALASDELSDDGVATVFHTGFQTPASAVPTSSSSVVFYDGQFLGLRADVSAAELFEISGLVEMDVDFNTSSMTGAVFAGTETSTTRADFNTILLSGNIVGSAVNGTAEIGLGFGNPSDFTVGRTGPLEMQFYGPSANELAGVLEIVDSNGDVLLGSMSGAP